MMRNSSGQEEFEVWRDTLRGFCGTFDVTPGDDLGARHGSFGARQMGGLELAHIATNYDALQRDETCIRRDDVDCLYLVHQISGRQRIDHCGRQEIIEAGDCVLLDSARPMWGHYGREGLEFVSLHIPRELFFRDAADQTEIEIGCARRVGDARGSALKAALRFVRDNAIGADTGQGFMVDLARLAFRADPRRPSLARFGRAADRTVALKELIARNAHDASFSLSHLAGLAGLSERQVQRDLQSDGTSFSREVQEIRLARVARDIRVAAREARPIQVAQVAYDAGFNDLSHFNRVFRRRFGCSPREMSQHSLEA